MATKLNAKERRKLLRQQQREQAAAEASQEAKPEDVDVVMEDAPVDAGPVEAETEIATEAVTPTKPEEPMNAKQRRLLKRQQKREAQGVEEKEAVQGDDKEEAGAPLNAKQRRLLKRKAERAEHPENVEKKQPVGDATAAAKKRKRSAKVAPAADNEDAGDAKRKRIHLTLFVGQLPFTATEAMVREHFQESGEIQLRMLTDKKTKKFKGTAFIEVRDSKALAAALARHHSLLQGRRINVELTANGGGNNSTLRRGRIDSLREKQRGMQLEKTRALVQKHIDSKESQLSNDDIDDRVIDFMSWFDFETAKKALDEYTSSVSDRVKNRKAFFMGILKRFRQTDGVEEPHFGKRGHGNRNNDRRNPMPRRAINAS